MHNRIRTVRRSASLNQDQFAERLKLTKNYVSLLETGKRVPSDRTVLDICREFNVNEHWLRTGEGEMLREISRTDEIAQFFGDLLKNEPDFRYRLISVLARMSADEWRLLESKMLELSDEIKKASP